MCGALPYFGCEQLRGKRGGDIQQALTIHLFCRYPGGKWFDPFGFSRGDEASLASYKEKEVKNGRLAILVSPTPP